MISTVKEIFVGAGRKTRYSNAIAFLNSGVWTAHAPYRLALLNPSQLQEHAGRLGRGQDLSFVIAKLPGPAAHEKTLHHLHCLLSQLVVVSTESQIAGWLLDNFYILDDQLLKESRKDHVESIGKILDQGVGRDERGCRLYALACHLIAHTDGQVDIDHILHFLTAYQEHSILTQAELHAIIPVFRLALLENIIRIALRITAVMYCRSSPDLLQEKTLWLNYDNDQLQEDKISLRHNISSLKQIGSANWNELIAGINAVNAILCKDAAGIYAKMDFLTRERYCNVVERLAAHSKYSETEVSEIAVQLSVQSIADTAGEYLADHVGFYLVDKGMPRLLKALNTHRSATEGARYYTTRFSGIIYFGLITCLTILFTLPALSAFPGSTMNYMVYPLAMLVLAAALQAAITIVNWLSGMFYTPELLPRMDYAKGIPEECSTIVVIPCVPVSEMHCRKLLKDLEVRYCGNMDPHLHFALLTDFADAGEEQTADDDVMLELLKTSISDLNYKYGCEEKSIFFLFHRPRKFNNVQNVWMGEERKRGKLTDLCRLLGNPAVNNFLETEGSFSILESIRYVITLDQDTMLPPNAAAKMIGTMAHPLNKPMICERRNRVSRGYGILQPRVAIGIESSNRSLYSRIHSNAPGIDAYTRVHADLYQDVFGEGTFVGKGIFELKSFLKILDKRFPDNRILSHDLLEGCYLRSGLLTDVQLFEEHPVSYLDDARRRHRWIRGDWQIAAWILPFVPGYSGSRHRNPLSLLSRWKIFDNLRRSVMPVVYILLLMYSWLAADNASRGTLLVILTMLLPALLSFIHPFIYQPLYFLKLRRWKSVLLDVRYLFLQNMNAVAMLPFEAFYALDAIVRTIVRIYITRKNTLEWHHTGRTLAGISTSIMHTYRYLYAAPVVGGAAVLFLGFYSPAVLWVATPVLLSWLSAPLLTWMISQSGTVAGESVLGKSEKAYLRELARKHWRYFETFMGPDDNWLPPDHYQEYPVKRIAHRTSPTNIGIGLLSCLAANDFGFITQGELLLRCMATLDTMSRLERFKNHFYNWYDTRTLKTVNHKYVSTVDSGNLAASLLTLWQGMLALRDKKMVDYTLFEGLHDVLRILIKQAGDLQPLLQLKNLLDNLSDKQDYEPVNLNKVLDELCSISEELLQTLNREDTETEIYKWALSFLEQVGYIREELKLCESSSTYTALSSSIPTLRELRNMITADSAGARELERRWDLIEQICNRCREFSALDYSFLYDERHKLLRTGFNAATGQRDNGFYDNLFSEARLATFIGIADNKLPQESWFALGRPVCYSEGAFTILSWSGSMFEYLMPLLFMPTYENTLMDSACRSAVRHQITHGKKYNLPWGISECAHNDLNVEMHYQYWPRGVPSLGLRRVTEEDLTIAPYAAALALMIAPVEACSNLRALSAEGAEGNYGFYEAVDYTPSRLGKGKKRELIYSYMVHHQGMSLLSFAYTVLNKPMQTRFLSHPQHQAAAMLLQERMICDTSFSPHRDATLSVHAPVPLRATEDDSVKPTTNTAVTTAMPDIMLLSNGNYHVMVNNSGSGYSRWNDLSVTRWRQDSTNDCYGITCYICDVDTGVGYSAGYMPTRVQPEEYETQYIPGKASLRRVDDNLESTMSITVSQQQDMELRRLVLHNRSLTDKNIEITSFAEISLTDEDIVHPALGKLSIEMEVRSGQQAIVCSRRKTDEPLNSPYFYHTAIIPAEYAATLSYETDRLKFIGRRKSTMLPDALVKSGELSGGSIHSLDPIAAIRCRVTIPAGQKVSIDMLFGIEKNLEACEKTLKECRMAGFTNKAFALAEKTGLNVMKELKAGMDHVKFFNALAASVIYANNSFRTSHEQVSGNYDRTILWKYGLSARLPVVMITVKTTADLVLTEKILKAQAWWYLNGLFADLIIINDDRGSYSRFLESHVNELIMTNTGDQGHKRKGSVLLLRLTEISAGDYMQLKGMARIIITDEQDTVPLLAACKEAVLQPAVTSFSVLPAKALPMPVGLQFFNGHGGFSRDGREYVIYSTGNNATPMPWANVLCNPGFGTIVTESGHSYTWSGNAGQQRLTPWHNDPVSDTSGEAYYMRDEDTGKYWSLSYLPSPGSASYITKHGFGYTVFEHEEDELYTSMKVYADIQQPVKYVVIKVNNRSERSRRLSVTGYTEWVLDMNREISSMHICTDIDLKTGAVFSWNRNNSYFQDRTCFFHTDNILQSFTCDRIEFIGRNGSAAGPAGMEKDKLSGATGIGLDACAAIKAPFELAGKGEYELVFLLGCGKDRKDAARIIQDAAGKGSAEAFERVAAYWKRKCEKIQLHTPDAAVNVLANGWLTYQTISSRLWARSGYYESSGAFGFRDQLQDMLSILHAAPLLARRQLLNCAAHQFEEGDVLHWWHPRLEKGVRTNCSDDLLWMPHLLCRYVTVTGDVDVLDEVVPYLSGRKLDREEKAVYDCFLPGSLKETLYGHCKRAIGQSVKLGVHGLPLMGTGDWNDSMSHMGREGKGESVWLAWFFFTVLNEFAIIAELRQDKAYAAFCRQEAENIRTHAEKNAWDGEWYISGYFDNGASTGSVTNTEGKINAATQAWAVLSGAARGKRAHIAIESAHLHLVDKEHNLVRLLTPAFNTSTPSPGYIRSFFPGVKENGGQHTQAAIWLAMAFARIKDYRNCSGLLDIINPIKQSSCASAVATYKAEPYVMAEDIYAMEPHQGRAGWTWFTGAAGWMYQLIVEYIAGLSKEGTCLRFNPCLPEDWKSIEVYYKFHSSTYHIVFQNAIQQDTFIKIEVDGVSQPDNVLQLLDDGELHHVVVRSQHKHAEKMDFIL